MAFLPANLKLVYVGDQNGLSNISNQQATHRTIYQMVDLATAGNQITFFQNLGGLNFPFTNLTQNSLTAMNALAIQRIAFQIVTRTAGGQFLQIQAIEESAFPQFNLADMSLIISNTQVIDRLNLGVFLSTFNSESKFSVPSVEVNPAAAPGTAITRFHGQSVKELATNPIILPMQEFTCPVHLPAYTAPAADTVYLKIILEGFGTLAAPNGRL
jgi:hypothetical protein